ncbi:MULTISPECIES: hypothetical protein [Halomonas]|uniref:hypothetical protein n=1 Tax=Halomonas TaxID=2745 RepID=UPI001C98B763|nr:MULTISPECIES: hypothetical protein [Halomonas]MBR9770031.1 hypothetical protein [Gammaproteobacteria bacterium]MBY6208753.1 hypothetical protein [Halomonas sp. DP3Y7-2]MBY6227223.1 hypothetical protein [Halomonas sp. DP3Y7-1]MCA0915027.1 hypothetical protein [Halomonas denitrificans]
MTSTEYKALTTEARRYRRLYRGFLWSFVLASVFAVAQTFDKAAIREDYADTVAAYRAAVYGLTYALSEEQAKAGGFEAEANDHEQKLDNERGYAWNLRQEIKRLEHELQQCQATQTMITSPGWTGSTSIIPEDSR